MKDDRVISAFDHFSPMAYDRLARFIEDHSGIRMPPSKQNMAEGRLRKRARVLNLPTLDAYVDHVFSGQGVEDELVHLVDLVTTNKTDFFREPQHFEFLARQILPEFTPELLSTGQSLKIWSAPCSTGPEPYTAAMIVAEWQRQHPNLRAEIFGVDLSTAVLEKAIEGIYSEAMLDPVPHDLRRRYFMRSKDRKRGLARLVPEIRRMVRFGHMNLMDPSYNMPRGMHLIFCRNTLIYFDRPTQRAVVKKLTSHLRPGGYLFLGHAETMADSDLSLRQVGPSTYKLT